MGLQLRLATDREGVRIDHARLSTSADVDKLIQVLGIVRQLIVLNEPQHVPAAQTVSDQAPAQSVETTPAAVESVVAGEEGATSASPASIPEAKATEAEPPAGTEPKADGVASRSSAATDTAQAGDATATMAASPAPIADPAVAADLKADATPPAGEVGHNASPAPKPVSLASRIRAYMDEHPDATVRECATALGETVERIRGNGKGMKFAPATDRSWHPKPGQLSTRARVKKLHDEHPEFTRQQAWEHLGITEGSLAGHGSALGIKWAPAKAHPFEKSPQPAQEASSYDPAPTTAREPERPPAPSYSPSIVPTGRTSPGAVVTKPAVRPRGTLFWLRNDDGEYLDRFCNRMTRDRREAWTGTQDQLAGCRRAFSIARDLREVIVEKEPARV